MAEQFGMKGENKRSRWSPGQAKSFGAGFIALPRPAPVAPPETVAPPAPAVPRPAPKPAPQAPGVDRFYGARQFLNETVVNAVGLRSFLFTLRLEKANSLSDLRLLLPDYAKLMEKGTGKLEAEVLVRRARELTSEAGPARR